MNYQDWGHNFTRIEPDVLNHVLPFVESNYNVSQEREGRGYAGLSAGAGTTARFYLNHPDKFSQFGIWSNGVNPTAEQLARIAQYKDSTSVHIALAKWDFVTAGRAMSNTLTANGIPHAFNEIPGGHDWEFWQLMLAEFAEDHLWVDDDPQRAVCGIRNALDDYVAAGDMEGPIVNQLSNALRQADRHIEADRPKQAVAALERALTRLEKPKRPDRVTDRARRDLTAQIQGVIDTLR